MSHSTLSSRSTTIPKPWVERQFSSTASTRASIPEVRQSWAWERWLARQMYLALGAPNVALELWDGSLVSPPQEAQIGIVRLRQPSVLWKLIGQGSIGFGEAYADCTLEIDGDLITVLTAINRSMAKAPPSQLMKWRDWWLQTRHRHSLADSRSSVFHHYDIGNDFYQHWLDERLVYTCAYYAQPEMTLEDAQVAKLDHVCRKLRLKPGESVAEAGCGWGALALHMARTYGVRVKAFNLSREQLAYARDLARREGLSNRVEFIEDDYRQIRGRFDAFVSVGMLEHVGVDQFSELGRLIDRVLVPHGRGLIHSIGRDVAAPLDPWTDKYIFPGAEPPSLAQMMSIFETGRFSVCDVENLRRHYATTCREWFRRFEDWVPRATPPLDPRFVRIWQLYLAASTAAFQSGDLQLFQVLFARNDSPHLPRTRADLYANT